ncbi:UDP-N-acetylmuramate dehydrogenase [Candidatus Bipolaricaulota bacterium]
MVRIDEPRDLKTDVPLHPLTSLRVGGKARFFAEPVEVAAVADLLRWTTATTVDWACLGGGTNVLVPDAGLKRLLIRTTALRGLSIDGNRVTAAAGEPLARVARLACEAGLSGLEWACGIPGTVGGAVVMNAGTREGETGDVLSDVTEVDEKGSTRRREAVELGLGYRRSAFLDGALRGVIVGASFELASSLPERTLSTVRRLLDERARRFPEGATAGCTFRNPLEGPTAGELLDRAGCKGLRVGDAHVSTVHANFIVNDGAENAADVLQLIEAMKARVKDVFGVELVEEIVVFS